ncbi:Glucans biosynthesis glucosyltransferase H [compost metagenome]
MKGSKEFGGPFKVLVSVLIEVLFSVLLAPVRMIFHTRFVVAAFLGWAATWNSPQRDDDSTPWTEALRRHGPQSALGLAWTVLVFSLNPGFLWWLAPIVISLMLSIPVSVISSRTTLGKQARSDGLFLIPEEHAVPPELAKTYAYTASNRKRAVEHGFLQAVVAPTTNLLARGLATARHRSVPVLENRRDEVVQHALAIGPERLDAATRLYVLNDPVVLERLHCAVWSQEERTWVNAWRHSPQTGHASPVPDVHLPQVQQFV